MMIKIILYQIDTNTIVSILLVVLVIVYVAGFKFRKLLEKKGMANEHLELGTVEGALLGLFAFFLAFTFDMSGDRFDKRRETTVLEATKIESALNLTELYPDSVRRVLRAHFKSYVDDRIAYHDAGIDEEKLKKALNETRLKADKIRAIVSTLGKNENYAVATRVMAPALNEMAESVIIRDEAKNATVPESILWVLFFLSICSGFMVGYGNKGKNQNYVAGIILVIMISAAIYLILDLDRPRRGIITTERAESKIVELKSLFD